MRSILLSLLSHRPLHNSPVRTPDEDEKICYEHLSYLFHKLPVPSSTPSTAALPPASQIQDDHAGLHEKLEESGEEMQEPPSEEDERRRHHHHHHGHGHKEEQAHDNHKDAEPNVIPLTLM